MDTMTLCQLRNDIASNCHRLYVDGISHSSEAMGDVHRELAGLPELCAAKALLAGSQAARHQLDVAAHKIWSAMFYRHEWPATLQAHADALEPVLFRYGVIATTIETMTDDECDEMQRELIAFIDAAEAAAPIG